MNHIKVLLAAFLCLLILPLNAFAVSTDVEVMTATVDPAKAQLDLRLRVPSSFSASDFEKDAVFTIGGKEVALKSDSVTRESSVGYILVIDRSGYYTAHLEYDFVKSVATQIIQAMDDNDRVAVVFVDSGTECNDNFMHKTAAISLINASESTQRNALNGSTEAMLYTGIQKAQTLAGKTSSTTPNQKVIVILSDFGADDSPTVKQAVLNNLNNTVPIITIPFWCNGYSPSSNSRRIAMNAAQAGRSELLGYSSFNAEIVVQTNSDDFDSNQAAAAAKLINENMNFISCSIDIMPLYQVNDTDTNRDLRINYHGEEITKSITINYSAIATPELPSATPSPTPDLNPVVLRFGDENADVLTLQQILTDLYYYTGEMNRKYDTAVQLALMEFCADHGLEFGDELRQDVWQFLQSNKANPKATPTPEPINEPTKDPNLFLQMGDKDAKVYNLQTKLTNLGYLAEENVTMVFDEATQLALYSFCEENGLELRDGLTVKMWNLLQSGNAVPKPTATPEPTPVVTPAPTRDPNQKYALGDQNGGVRALQNYLISHYYLDAEYRTGIFDSNTQWAVDDFCTENGLAVIDDGMSLEAWDLLQSGTAKAKATAVPETPTPAPTRDPQLKFLLDDSNDQVIVLQRRLAQMYYLDEKDISGIFDQKTLIAVVAFCDVNGLTGDGLRVVNGMSNDAWNLLMAGSPKANPTATPAPTAVPTAVPTAAPTVAPEFLAIAPGDNNSYVRRFQQRLVELGYLTDEFTAGTYDKATQDAQNKLCEYNNIAPQSGADIDLQQLAFSTSIKNMTTMGFGEKLQFMMNRTLNIGSLKIPMWILACVCLVLFLVAIVMILVMPRKKQLGHSSTETSTTNNTNKLDITAEDMPTGDLDIDVNGDVPTSENINNWQVMLTVTYMGHSSDNKYTLIDGIPIKIGRRSGNEVLLNAEDTTASREHGQLVYRGNKLFYNDTSKKGSYVDGNLVHQSECEVKSGSVIEISRHRIQIIT